MVLPRPLQVNPGCSGHAEGGRGHSGGSGAATSALSVWAFGTKIRFRIADAEGHDLPVSATRVAQTAMTFSVT